MSKLDTVLILGNGFDIDLGLETKYTDFIKSPYWKNYMNDSRLYHYVKHQSEQENWSGLENDLLDYINEVSNVNPSTDDVKKDKECYWDIHNLLTAYIQEQQAIATLNNESVAANILNIVLNYARGHIYSFNYTDLQVLANKLGIHKQVSYEHLHGSINANDIIVGVDEVPFESGYECFRKMYHSSYKSNTLQRDLNLAREIIFFGMSFGRIDYCYFKEFFQKLLSMRNILAPQRKLHITFFTFNEDSCVAMKSAMEQNGISIQKLHDSVDIDFIKTKDGCSLTYYMDLIDRLTNGTVR